MVHGIGRFTVRNINAESNCTLVQVGLAIRVTGRETHHGGCRDASKDNDSDVRDTLVTDVFKHRIESPRGIREWPCQGYRRDCTCR